MIYIMGTWAHTRDLCKKLGLRRGRDFYHYTRPSQLLGLEKPNIVVLVTAYSGNRNLMELFKEITRRQGVTWGEEDLIEGKVPR